jgi:hypothetical protein
MNEVSAAMTARQPDGREPDQPLAWPLMIPHHGMVPRVGVAGPLRPRGGWRRLSAPTRSLPLRAGTCHRTGPSARMTDDHPTKKLDGLPALFGHQQGVCHVDLSTAAPSWPA